MKVLNKQDIVLLCAVMVINGEHWYSGKINGGVEIFMRAKEKYNRTYEQQQNESNLLDLWSLPNESQLFVQAKSADNFHNTVHQKHIGLKINNKIKFSNTNKKISSKNKLSSTKNTSSLRTLKNFHSNKTTRFLNVFQVVEFEHEVCISSEGLEGICLHEYDCESNGGTDTGVCADGFGTCCVAHFSCDGSSSASLGWFTNPDFPSATTERLVCTFTVNKASEDISQLRLDFKIFELLPPTGGTCQHDQFLVSGQNRNNIVPIICGINNDQHFYIEVGDVNGPIYLTIQTVSAASRTFSIKFTQLTRRDELAAPSGCLQYFKEAEGSILSFNYFDALNFSTARTPLYLNNLNYAMCIERNADCCSVTYSNSGDMQIINYDNEGLPVIPPNQAGVEIFNCPHDWLLIAATRLCGDRLNDGSVIEDFSYNAPVTDNGAGPIVVWFRSDSAYSGRGFNLYYQQNPCSNAAQ